MLEAFAVALDGTTTLLLAIAIYVGLVLVSATVFAGSQRLTATFFLISAFAIFVFTPSLLDWVKKLGVDSFLETHSFDLAEATFLLSTLTRLLHPMEGWQVLITALATVAVFASVVAAVRWQKVSGRKMNTLATVVIISALLVLTTHYFARFRANTDLFEGVTANFDNAKPPATGPARDMRLIVYIGESTTSGHWQLYGYPRPTTPKLSAIAAADPKLLVFDNVLSTHTHTSQSLLRALSVPANEAEAVKILPIYKLKRLSLLDVLGTHGINTLWISNQSQTGTYSLASSVIAKNADKVRWSVDTKYAPDAGAKLARPFDHEFLLPQLDSLLRTDPSLPQAVFLHSYAGHGDYSEFVPPSHRGKVDKFLDQIEPRGVIGNLNNKKLLTKDSVDARILSEVEAYDSAMVYIDNILADIISRIQRSPDPSVFIYFSDHGEALFSGRGHTVSRFIHEMVRVPFIIYMNQAAAQRYPELLDTLSESSKSGRVASLSQFSETVFHVFGLSEKNAYGKRGRIGEGLTDQSRNILIREVGGTFRKIDLLSARPTDDTLADDATNAYIHDKANSTKGQPLACYHRANSFGKLWRAAMVAPCIEFDLLVSEDGSFDVTHPPLPPTGLTFEHVLTVAARRNQALWIDGKNIGTPRNCNRLQKKLSQLQWNGQILAEFPGTTDLSDTDMLTCIRSIRSVNTATSFYVPTKLALACTEGLLQKKNDWRTIAECKELDRLLLSVVESDAFTDFSFSRKVVRAMETLAPAQRLEWNTWGVSVQELSDYSNSRYRMIIFDTRDDPNHT